jgi:NAD+ synthase
MAPEYASMAQHIRDFIRETLTTAGVSRLVVNISGGVDSAVTAALALQAVGSRNLFLAMMPYGELGTQGVHHASLLVEALQMPQEQVLRIDIKRAVDAISEQAMAPDRVRLGNIMARVRMIFLFDLAKRLGALVCGTENRTEHYLGYFTRFGDAASDLEPIRGLYKTQVWELARALDIPAPIIEQAPTAGLWEAQTDEGELGFSYQDADRVLTLSFDEHLGIDEIAARGLPREIVLSVLEHVARNDFKHRLPYIYAGEKRE